MAKNTLTNYYARETLTGEIDHRLIYIQDKDNLSSGILKRRYKNSYMIIDKAIPVVSYNILYSSIPRFDFFINEEYVRNSSVIKLANVLIDIINNNSFYFTNGYCFEKSFYNFCINSLLKSKILNEDDIDLLYIYLKQLVTILKYSNQIYNSRGIARVRKSISSNARLYLGLFSTFWNEVCWEDIFPSLPYVAKALKKNRTILTGLMLKKEYKFQIDEIANDFFKIIGLGGMNDLYLISFIDFYFFTWLAHFGIINYFDGNDNDPVMVELTKHGRRFLNSFIATHKEKET